MDFELARGDPTLGLPCAHGGPVLCGALRTVPEDFLVTEQLGYLASGDGEHVFLTVRKRARNTHEVARALAKLAGVAQVAVGYAGLKDRQAVTTQHFTVQLPGRDAPDWSALEDDTLQVIDTQSLRVIKTLKPGKGVLHMEFEPRGEEVWASVRDEDRVAVFDTATFEQVTTIEAEKPSGIFLSVRAHRTGL